MRAEGEDYTPLSVWLEYRSHTARCSVLNMGAFSHSRCDCGCHLEDLNHDKEGQS